MTANQFRMWIFFKKRSPDSVSYNLLHATLIHALAGNVSSSINNCGCVQRSLISREAGKIPVGTFVKNEASWFYCRNCHWKVL